MASRSTAPAIAAPASRAHERAALRRERHGLREAPRPDHDGDGEIAGDDRPEGVGTQAHIAGEYLSLLTQSKMVHVPYRSSPAALNDLLAGHLDINFQSVPAVRSYFGSPLLKMLAVLSAERLKEWPDIPTMAESGLDPVTPEGTATRLSYAIRQRL